MSYRDYTVTFENVSIAAAQDFFELTPADDKPIKIMGILIHPVGGTADATDAESENWRASIVRGHTTSGSGGSAPTPQPIASTADSAAGFTAEANNTTIASTAGTTIGAFGIPVRTGVELLLPEEFWWGASQANTTIVVRLLSTPADAVAMSGTLFVREFG
jgi:hypothetical protein